MNHAMVALAAAIELLGEARWEVHDPQRRLTSWSGNWVE